MENPLQRCSHLTEITAKCHAGHVGLVVKYSASGGRIGLLTALEKQSHWLKSGAGHIITASCIGYTAYRLVKTVAHAKFHILRDMS